MCIWKGMRRHILYYTVLPHYLTIYAFGIFTFKLSFASHCKTWATQDDPRRMWRVADGKSSDTLWENAVALLTTSDVPRPNTLPELQGLQRRRVHGFNQSCLPAWLACRSCHWQDAGLALLDYKEIKAKIGHPRAERPSTIIENILGRERLQMFRYSHDDLIPI